jgi:hypothetical protein
VNTITQQHTIKPTRRPLVIALFSDFAVTVTGATFVVPAVVVVVVVVAVATALVAAVVKRLISVENFALAAPVGNSVVTSVASVVLSRIL